MWERSELKAAAKVDLKGFYWLSFAVCLLVGILGGASGGASSGLAFLTGSGDSLSSEPLAVITPILAIIFSIVFMFAFVIALVITAFVTCPIIVGKCRFFVHPTENDRDIATLFSAFKKGSYISVVKTMFLTNLFIGLWTLLFIIPGIVKSYSYRMVPYILSEKPDIHYKEALEISRTMTKGVKFDMFMLDLSFIGWYFLGALAFGVGTLFVSPYVEATWAQLYLRLRERANNSYTPA